MFFTVVEIVERFCRKFFWPTVKMRNDAGWGTSDYVDNEFACRTIMSDTEELKDEDKEVVKKLGLKIKSYTDIQKFKLDK